MTYKCNYIDSMLCVAVNQNDIVGVENALLKGANPNSHFGSQYMPVICQAAANKNRYIIEMLFSAGANVNECNVDNLNAAFFSVFANDVESLDLLMSFGAETTNICRYDSSTILHFAASSGMLELCSRVYSKKIDINQRNIDGVTALHVASERNFGEICNFLISHGANTDFKTKHGLTALELAKELECDLSVRAIEGWEHDFIIDSVEEVKSDKGKSRL